MRILFTFMCVLALGLMGCSETSGTGGTAGDGGMGGSAGIGGEAGAGGGTVTIPKSVTTWEGAPEGVKHGRGPALSGVEVCETDRENCAITDADGQATIMLPADQEVSYIASKDGRVPRMAAEVTDVFSNVRQPRFTMWLDEDMEAFAEANMIPYPLTGGAVLLHMNPTATEGVTFTLIDDEGASPYYADEDGFFRFDLTETTVNGFGGFFEMAPGDRQIEFGGAATNCTAALGWPGDAPNRVKVPVRVGHVTLASMNCDVQ